ncbi:SEL1-like repeat protein [Dyella sp. C11]|uniref:tetratricopeptide repeat protein n=1 Tax=Dyella sp. C11 TaxID=2126991 RepID=UPI0013006570|nr:SEL1-like repeat protein [Dyella sp. C11]
MKTMVMGALLLASCAVSAATMDDPASHEVLAAMARTSTWGHPDEFGEFVGMRYYASGDYAKAMKYFDMGARYADKLSQLSIGLMYLNGEGVEKNPVMAYAWLSLAAERNYPRYVATRDAVGKQLDAGQRAQASEVLAQLSSEYGDEVAKRRLERELRQTRTTMTGSLVGYGSSYTGSLTYAQFVASAGANVLGRMGANAMPPCGARSIDGAPITGCDNLFVSWRWDPKQYFDVRDATWMGTVTVGDLQQQGTTNH